MTRTRHTTHPLAVPVVARDVVGAVTGALPTALGRGGGGGLNPQRRQLPVHGAYHYTVYASYAVMRKDGSKLAKVFTPQCNYS